jgi:maltooligosyltrehalose trehalohydrolase
VHGPSQIIDPYFAWEDGNWCGLPWPEYIIYELHVGTFTAEGTFEAIIPCLDELKELGITAIELMPVAQFPGSRNWGYDGVYPYAVQHSYGGPQGLKRLVNACHQRDLAMILDVVYNHLGPEGNYLGDFGFYFTDRYKTPWGPALNFDGPYGDEVRRYFIENALYWITECHIDALRLDAVHAIVDHSAYTFLEELTSVVHQQAERLNRRVHLMAESNLDDTRIIRSAEAGGYGLDAQWNDDFHHALHTLLTGERDGYYQDFGKVTHLAKAFTDGYVYSGQYSAFRQRRHGNSSRLVPAHKFVVCAQNHDQIGNRMLGGRLGQLVSFEGLKLAAGVVLLSPFIPLLFMGEEYDETAPFQYFISHTDPKLIEVVRQGRREEFALNPFLRHQEHHAVLRAFYKALIRLRRTLPALARLSKDTLEVCSFEREKVLCVRRWSNDEDAFMSFNFHEVSVSMTLPLPAGHWYKRLDSADECWNGPGSSMPAQLSDEENINLTLSPHSLSLFSRTTDV